MVHKVCIAISFSVVFVLASGHAFAGSWVDYVGGHAARVSNWRSNSAVADQASNDVQFTYKLDVPWDWAHRYPPGFLPPVPPVTVGIARPVSGNTNFTYTFDVPWDWAHRYPPGFLAGPPESPLPPPIIPASGCRAQDVAVGPDKQQTVTIV